MVLFLLSNKYGFERKFQFSIQPHWFNYWDCLEHLKLQHEFSRCLIQCQTVNVVVWIHNYAEINVVHSVRSMRYIQMSKHSWRLLVSIVRYLFNGHKSFWAFFVWKMKRKRETFDYFDYLDTSLIDNVKKYPSLHYVDVYTKSDEKYWTEIGKILGMHSKLIWNWFFFLSKIKNFILKNVFPFNNVLNKFLFQIGG